MLPDSTLRDFEIRVARMERQNRRWRAGACTLLVAFAAVALIAADSNTKLKPIDTSALRLWDNAGRLRAVLTSSQKGNAALALMDEQGKVCATLGVGREGAPGLEMSSHNGKVRLRLEACEDGHPIMRFVDAQGHLLSELAEVENHDSRDVKTAAGQKSAGTDGGG